MSNLHVLQLASSAEPFFREQVRALEASGVECTSIVVPESVHESSDRGVREYLEMYRDLLETPQNEYDLIHANYGLMGPFALAQSIRPVVLTLWGSEVMGYSRRLDRISRFAAARSDTVIAPNRAVASRLSCEHTVIPFGIDLDRFRPIDRDVARARVGWPPDDRIVVFPYSPDRAVKRYELAKNVVARASVQAELRTVSDRPYEEMPAVMNAADVLLVTSERESGPMVVREAAACNIPVVSTDVGFAAETLKNVENCAIGRTRAELIEGLEAALRSSGRSNGRTAVTAYNTDRMAASLLSVYRSLLGRTDSVTSAYSPPQSPSA